MLVALKQRYGCFPKCPSTIRQGEPEIFFDFDENSNFEGAQNAIEAAMTPAPDKLILAAITELEIICARGRADDKTNQISLRAQVSRLREFPADAVLATLKEWPVADFSTAIDERLRRANTFCPSLSDLINGIRDQDGYYLFRGIKARISQRQKLRHAFYYWHQKFKLNQNKNLSAGET